jgi:ABC-type lipoprotein release transport system permease subunit
MQMLDIPGGNMLLRKMIRNKKAELEGMIKIISWIVFFGIALGGMYFLIKRFTG